MNEHLTVKAIMMKHPEIASQDPTIKQPISIDENKSIEDALEMLQKYKIRHLPVMSGGHVAGIVSDRDIKMAMGVYGKLALGLIGQRPALTVGNICRRDPYTATPDTPIKEVAKEMADHQYGCVIILEKNRLVGMITTVDICRLVANSF